jgi:hypothetical protein
VKMLANELIDKSRQRRETFASAILQGCCDINLLWCRSPRFFRYDYMLACLGSLGLLSARYCRESLGICGRSFECVVRKIRSVRQSFKDTTGEQSAQLNWG